MLVIEYIYITFIKYFQSILSKYKVYNIKLSKGINNLIFQGMSHYLL
jgi:hypothetical protein